jgi:hypothetical protein
LGGLFGGFLGRSSFFYIGIDLFVKIYVFVSMERRRKDNNLDP